MCGACDGYTANETKAEEILSSIVQFIKKMLNEQMKFWDEPSLFHFHCIHSVIGKPHLPSFINCNHWLVMSIRVQQKPKQTYQNQLAIYDKEYCIFYYYL